MLGVSAVPEVELSGVEPAVGVSLRVPQVLKQTLARAALWKNLGEGNSKLYINKRGHDCYPYTPGHHVTVNMKLVN